MSSKGTVAEQRQDVADVASRIFGAEVTPERVIGETLVRSTLVRDPSPQALAACVRSRGDAEADDPALHAGYESLRSDPLASWIEDRFGLAEEEGSGTLVRRTPTTVSAAAADLAQITDEDQAACAIAIRATLLAGSRSRTPDGLRPLFAFRLHQFVSKGGSVYVTAQDQADRSITSDFQLSLPPATDDQPERRLYPLAFCRECGQEYLMVRREPGDDPAAPLAVRFVARHESRVRDQQDGYLYVSATYPWPKDPVVENRLPASWLEESPRGVRVVRARRDDVPSRYLVEVDGSAVGASTDVNPDQSPTLMAYVPGQFRFCLACGVSYEAIRSAEYSKLVTLDKEGRSSAMTVLASSTVRALKDLPPDELDPQARKLLTFVDNRQDASLQAGHFNDFVLVSQLRAALQSAMASAGEDGLSPLDLGPALVKALDLAPEAFAQAPGMLDLSPARRALREVVVYRAMNDLRRGWRVTLPNLEQTGLLVVDYPTLVPLSERDDLWEGTHPVLAAAAMQGSDSR